MPARHVADERPADRLGEESRVLIRRLAEERQRQGFTQAQVAKRMGTSQPYVARLEAAGNDPRLSTVLKYAAIVAGGVLLGAILRELERNEIRPGSTRY